MKKILLVEATASLAEEIGDILRLEGYDLTIASNGKQGLVLLKEVRPDLIVTDLLMPGMSWFDLFRK